LHEALQAGSLAWALKSIALTLWPLRSFSKPATCEALGSVLFITAKANFSSCILSREARPYSENRLRGGNRLAGIFLAHLGDLGLQRLERRGKDGAGLLIVAAMRRSTTAKATLRAFPTALTV